jgi:hypothetical protein
MDLETIMDDSKMAAAITMAGFMGCLSTSQVFPCRWKKQAIIIGVAFYKRHESQQRHPAASA